MLGVELLFKESLKVRRFSGESTLQLYSSVVLKWEDCIHNIPLKPIRPLLNLEFRIFAPRTKCKVLLNQIFSRVVA